MRQAPQPAQATCVDANSSAQEKIELFLSLFRGREDIYARRYYSLKTGKSGYVPACKNEWEPDQTCVIRKPTGALIVPTARLCP